MNEEQNKKFEEWLHKQKFLKRFDGFSPTLATTLTDLVIAAKDAWQACLDANKVEEVEEQEPSPTEMVKRLFEKGWEVRSGRYGDDNICLWNPTTDKILRYSIDGLKSAYLKEFPRKRKRKVEVEVWLDTDGCIQVIPPNSDSKGLDQRRISWGWTKSIATFWVEESGD